MIDAKLEAIDLAIAELNTKRIARIMDIQDAGRQANRAKFQTIADSLAELDEAGEAIRAHQGVISGTFFRINPDYTVEEI